MRPGVSGPPGTGLDGLLGGVGRGGPGATMVRVASRLDIRRRERRPAQEDGQVGQAIDRAPLHLADEALEPPRETTEGTVGGPFTPGGPGPRRDAAHDAAVAGTGGSPASPAASRSCDARPRRSHGRSRSGRPKWPYAAVGR